MLLESYVVTNILWKISRIEFQQLLLTNLNAVLLKQAAVKFWFSEPTSSKIATQAGR